MLDREAGFLRGTTAVDRLIVARPSAGLCRRVATFWALVLKNPTPLIVVVRAGAEDSSLH